jgi:hypothetical protein
MPFLYIAVFYLLQLFLTPASNALIAQLHSFINTGRGTGFIVMSIIVNYVPALIITYILAKNYQLRLRIPQPIKGLWIIITALSIMLLIYGALILSRFSPGGGLTFGLSFILLPFVLVSQIFLLIGVAKALLSITPIPDKTP